MRAVDRQAAGARVRRSNIRAARPASAIKMARKESEMPPGAEEPAPDAPPGAAGAFGKSGSAVRTGGGDARPAAAAAKVWVERGDHGAAGER